MIYCFDLDNTLCSNEGGNYALAKPYTERIKELNTLYDNNTIIIDSARGSITQIDHTELTLQQLKEWGIKYHILQVGKKVYADVYVDNNAINDLDFFTHGRE